MTKINSVTISFSFVLLIVALSLHPGLVLAQSAGSIPVSDGGGILTLARILQLLEQIATFIIAAGLTIAVGIVAYGGIKYILARDDKDGPEKAKTIIWNGIKGTAIILSVGLILRSLQFLIETVGGGGNIF